MEVGLAKKTLDDYYYQLRMAQTYGFDFERHKNDKIGVLRRFVKNCLRNDGSSQNVIKAEDNIDLYFATSSSDSEEDKYE